MFTNDEIKDFLLLSDTFYILKNKHIIDISFINPSRKMEIEINKKFHEICSNFFLSNELNKSDKNLLFLILAAYKKIIWDESFEKRFYKLLKNEGFFKLVNEFDEKEKKDRLNEINKSTIISIEQETFKIFEKEENIDLLSVFKNNVEKKDNKTIKNKYHKNGFIKYRIPYLDDKIDGILYQYDSKGNLLAEASYKNNKPDGLSKLYYENGKLEFEIISTNGVNSFTKQYYKSGKLKSKFYHDDKGDIHGIYTEYNSDGSLKKETLLEHGLVKEVKKYKIGIKYEHK